MAHIVRVTEELKWAAIREAFMIGTKVSETLKRDKDGKIILINGEPEVVKVGRFVNELQEAIDKGVLDEMVTRCANLYHEGNVQAVYTALAKNLDSQRCNMKDRPNLPTKKNDTIRLETLAKFVADRRTTTRSSGNLPQWAYGPAEIDAIDNLDKLQKVINSINDACCDKADGAYKTHLGDNYVEVAKANRAYAQKRKEELKAKESAVDPAILAKLSKGSKVALTQEEAALLLKLLQK